MRIITTTTRFVSLFCRCKFVSLFCYYKSISFLYRKFVSLVYYRKFVNLLYRKFVSLLCYCKFISFLRRKRYFDSIRQISQNILIYQRIQFLMPRILLLNTKLILRTTIYSSLMSKTQSIEYSIIKSSIFWKISIYMLTITLILAF